MVKVQASATVQATMAKDLREVFLMAFDNFATDPGEVVDAIDHVNSRYARELLGVLAGANLLTESDADGASIWQTTTVNLDNNVRADAEKVIDEWLASKNLIDAAKPEEAKAKKDKATTTKNLGAFNADGSARTCRCGCGAQVQGKSLYKPGHDARHAGQVARDLAAAGISHGGRPVDYTDVTGYKSLGSDKLRDKAMDIANRLFDKAAKKAPEPVVPTIIHGKVKIGRWEYAAETTNTDEAESGAVYIKKDGSRHPLTEDQYATVAWDPAA